MEERLQSQINAENARKARKSEANKILQIGGVLYSRNARRMVRERLAIEQNRAKERDIVWEKKYENACKRVFKLTRSHQKTWKSLKT